MDIYMVITLIGGVAFFLYGMNVMSTGLEKMSGSKLEATLKKMTSNPYKSLLLGAGITIAIQSSSAMTVMLVGLVNSGIMSLSQTVGVIMGSNVGTTFTAWLLSLISIDSGNVFINLLKPTYFSPLLAFAGILLIMGSKKKRRKDIGSIFVGFAVLMFGMNLMSDAVSPLADSPEFTSLLTAFNNPLLGVLVGALFTGVIQSSAASVGILQALSLTGSITYGMAIPIIMGQNIGTCVTAIISSFGVNRNAKRVAAVHILFNLIGTVICLSVFYILDAIFSFAFITDSISPFGIAVCHSIFNVATTAILLPFSGKLVKLANIVIKDSKETETFTLIDERLLATPSFAISECNNATIRMGELAKSTIYDSLSLFKKFDTKTAERIETRENELDLYEDKLGTYLVQLSSKDISVKDSRYVSKMLHTIGDFERIGDHAVNLLKVAREIDEKSITFSDDAVREINIITAALTEILDITISSFSENDIPLARKVEPLEQVIDRLTTEIKANHINRLQAGNCTIELGFILSDLITNFERVSDHCSNIAVALIEVEEGVFDTHEYLNDVKTAGTPEYSGYFDYYKNKYTL